MSILSKDEIDKISFMYEGDKTRDASSKIRGFLFQDYIAIDCLLKDNVRYVCSEYLEDVDVFYENGKFEFIQVKYYPNTKLGRGEVFTDLYYQYLRLQMLKSNLKSKPCLYIHGVSKVAKPTVEEMKEYIGLKIEIPKAVDYPDLKDSEEWLRGSVYALNKKEEQKKRFFATMTSENSLKSFIKELEISSKSNILEYKEKVMSKLAKEFSVYANGRNEADWRLILLGLAVSYVQKRYMLIDPNFESVKFDKEEFIKYMLEFSRNKTENLIVSYLVGIAAEVYGDIISDNNLSDLQETMLGLIHRNTVFWIKNIANTVEGQYKLLNTFSLEDGKKVSEYRDLPIDARIIKIAECKSSYTLFLQYMWKIILNLCQEKILQIENIKNNLDLLKPEHYIDETVMEYVCFNFTEDKYVSRYVILPSPGSNFRRITRKIAGRMIKLSQKPEKWLFENSKMLTGKNYYSYSAADIIENPTVTDLGEDSFYIECMECIGIDEKEWSIHEICRNCIFSEKCVNEEG